MQPQFVVIEIVDDNERCSEDAIEAEADLWLRLPHARVLDKEGLDCSVDDIALFRHDIWPEG